MEIIADSINFLRFVSSDLSKIITTLKPGPNLHSKPANDFSGQKIYQTSFSAINFGLAGHPWFQVRIIVTDFTADYEHVFVP